MMRKRIEQSQTNTVLELLSHVAAGMMVTFLILFVFFPELPLRDSINATVTVTAVKFVVNYFIRRYFTNIRGSYEK